MRTIDVGRTRALAGLGRLSSTAMVELEAARSRIYNLVNQANEAVQTSQTAQPIAAQTSAAGSDIINRLDAQFILVDQGTATDYPAIAAEVSAIERAATTLRDQTVEQVDIYDENYSIRYKVALGGTAVAVLIGALILTRMGK